MARAVGFDLDMTLVDTRPGIHAALVALAAESGRPIDADRVVARLGPPVAEALSPWFAEEELASAVAAFRVHMGRVGVMDVRPLRGAAEALAAVRARGHSTIVVTSKIEPLAVATLSHAGLQADAVFGDLWAGGKAQPLRLMRATAYVGDHPGDMLAATEASVTGVGVTSGSSSRDELVTAGAEVVIESLEEFPDWFASTVS